MDRREYESRMAVRMDEWMTGMEDWWIYKWIGGWIDGWM